MRHTGLDFKIHYGFLRSLYTTPVYNNSKKSNNDPSLAWSKNGKVYNQGMYDMK